MFYSTESPNVGRDFSNDVLSRPGSTCRLRATYCVSVGNDAQDTASALSLAQKSKGDKRHSATPGDPEPRSMP